jgi:hypothetical protein
MKIRQLLQSRPSTAVMEVVDNKWLILHPARFLSGAACSAQELWSQARTVIGISGHPPWSNYDMTAIGLGGFVTARGWLESGNPASMKISLKLCQQGVCKQSICGHG